jgi:hypothetical protein
MKEASDAKSGRLKAIMMWPFDGGSGDVLGTSVNSSAIQLGNGMIAK